VICDLVIFVCEVRKRLRPAQLRRALGVAARHGEKLIFPYVGKTDCSRLFVI
jgi:hypothetical protein